MTDWAPFEARVAGAFLRGYRWIAGLVGGFNLLVSVYTFTQPQIHHHRALSLELGIAGMGYLAFAWVPWTRVPDPAKGTLAFRLLMVWCALDALAMARISGDPTQHVNYIILLIGAGFTYPGRLNLEFGILVVLVSLALAGGPPAPWDIWIPAYFLAGMVSVCLSLLVRRLVSEVKLLHEKDLQTVAALQATLDQVRTLQGLVPICSYCKQVRNDDGFWEQVEAFVESHSMASFSHGVCPQCEGRLRDEFEASVPPEARPSLASPSAPKGPEHPSA